MTDDPTTTARLDTTDPDRPRGDVGLGDARRGLLAALGYEHSPWASNGMQQACRCDRVWRTYQEHAAHVADQQEPLVARWLGEERAAGWDEGHRTPRQIGIDHDAPNLTLTVVTPNPYRGDA